MKQQIRKQRRWMESIIATSRDELPALPFARGNRRAAKAAVLSARMLRRA